MKGIIWIIPSIFLTCCLIFNVTSGMLELNCELIDYAMVIIAVFGVLLIVPCFYIMLIKKNSDNKKSFIYSILYTFSCITLNAIIVCYKSILYYLGIGPHEVQYVDLFPLYIIVPGGMIIVGICIIILLSKLRKNYK